jgi:acetylcholinesterase
MLLFYLLLSVSCLNPLVNLDYGTFRGRESEETVDFYNIPFAAPPVGSLRFRAPRPPLNLTMLGIQDATKAGFD